MIKKIAKVFVFLLVAGFVAFYFWPQAKYQPHQVSADYQAQVDNFYVPPMPDGWNYDYFTASDGVKLRFGKGAVDPSARATLIVLPGFTGLLEQYGEHLSYWQDLGYNVAGIDIRGQGGSDRPLTNNPEKSWVSDFSVYARDIDELLAAEFADLKGPIILLGQSFGAHVAYRAVAEHGTAVDGLFLTVPAFQPNTGDIPYDRAKTLYKLSRLFNKTKFYAPGSGNWKPDVEDMTQIIACSSEPKRVYIRDAVYTNNPELRMGQATYQWFGQLMLSGEEMVKPEWTSRVSIPVSVMLGSKDQIIINEPPKQACNDMANCTLDVLDGAGHCLFQERDEFIEAIYTKVEDLVDRVAPTEISASDPQ